MPQNRRDLEHMRRTMNYVRNKPDGASFSLGGLVSSIGSGISNAVSSVGSGISNAVSGISNFASNLGGGGQDPGSPPPSDSPGNNSIMSMIAQMKAKMAAMKAAKAAAMGKMSGGAGENVVIKGKMTKGGGGSGMGFRQHFQGGFGADVQQGASMKGKGKRHINYKKK